MELLNKAFDLSVLTLKEAFYDMRGMLPFIFIIAIIITIIDVFIHNKK